MSLIIFTEKNSQRAAIEHLIQITANMMSKRMAEAGQTSTPTLHRLRAWTTYGDQWGEIDQLIADYVSKWGETP